MMYEVLIPIKFASLNEYVNMCRTNRYMASNYKKKTEQEIAKYIEPLPRFTRPVKLEFLWIEKDNRRDYDNIAFAKKFVLDALVRYGKLKDDNRKCVVGFTDSFGKGGETALSLTIKEADDGGMA